MWQNRLVRVNARKLTTVITRISVISRLHKFDRKSFTFSNISVTSAFE
jgi:hypothetical protein